MCLLRWRETYELLSNFNTTRQAEQAGPGQAGQKTSRRAGIAARQIMAEQCAGQAAQGRGAQGRAGQASKYGQICFCPDLY